MADHQTTRDTSMIRAESGAGPRPVRYKDGYPLPSTGRWVLLAFIAVCCFAWASWPLAPGTAAAQEAPNLFERQKIEQEAKFAFQRMITLWQEELYFELYEEGWRDSRKRITLEEFARRMVELPWVPKGRLDAKFLETEFHHRTMVYINARIDFQNRFNPAEQFTKDHTTLLIKEDGEWRIDLVQIIRAPFS